MLASLTGCGGGGGTAEPGDDAGMMTLDGGPLDDAGPRMDGGPVVPPYAPTPLQCSGTASSCRDASGSRTACEGIQGCDYGYCEYRTLACYGSASPYQCESGCEWDYSLEYCRRSSRGCERSSEDSCTSLGACQWSRAVSIFGSVPCQGTATACSALSQGACTSQPGCSLGCPAGRSECSGACVDNSRDDNHCGECGNACGADASCVSGTCECDDPTFTRDLCGVCDADPSNDCVRDCAGVPGGNAVTDDCGTCDANASNDCDCAGVPGGANVVDMCGTCDAITGNDCVQDCAGTWGGTATTDRCGVCDANAANDCDCLMVPGGAATTDQCGVCDTNTSNDCMIDCSGVWGGPDRRDMCGICDPDPNNDCVQDCSGQWGGTRSVDMCGVCDTNPNNDCVQDCAGTWGGSATVDNCGTCDESPVNDCVCRGQTCAASGPCFEGYCDLVTDTCMERAFADTTPCGDVATQICSATECVTRGCGDGFRETGMVPGFPREGCDDRNLSDGDACSAACVPTEYRLRVPTAAEEFNLTLGGNGELMVMDGLGNGLFVWSEDDRYDDQEKQLRASRIDRYGNFLDAAAPLLLDTASNNLFDASPSAVGLRTGGFVVFYTADRGVGTPERAFMLRMRRISPTGVVSPEQAVHGAMAGSQRYAQAAALDDGFVVVWQDITVSDDLWWRRFSNTGAALTPVTSLASTTNGRLTSPSVASHGNSWMATYNFQVGSPGTPRSLRGRRFVGSSPSGGEVVLVSTEVSSHTMSNVHPEGDSYLLLYNSQASGNIGDLYSMTVPRTAAGSLGTPVPLDTDPSRGAQHMQVAPYGPRGQGGYIVVYTDGGQHPVPLYVIAGIYPPPSELDLLNMVQNGEDYPAIGPAPYDLTGGSVWFAYTRIMRGADQGAVVFQLPPP